MVFLWVFLDKLSPGWPPQEGSIGPPPPAPRPLPVARCPDRKSYLPGDRPPKNMFCLAWFPKELYLHIFCISICLIISIHLYDPHIVVSIAIHVIMWSHVYIYIYTSILYFIVEIWKLLEWTQFCEHALITKQQNANYKHILYKLYIYTHRYI